MHPTLQKLLGGRANTKLIATHWDEILRLAASTHQGTVTVSLAVRKLGA
jgi:TnpA family transposase